MDQDEEELPTPTKGKNTAHVGDSILKKRRRNC